MRKLLGSVVLILSLAGLSQAQTQQQHHSTSRHNRSKSASATATCKDGTTSYSAHRRGTCSHHGGVRTWLNSSVPK
jgi:hypothetical protein